MSGLGLGMMRLPVLGGNDGAVDEAAAAKMIDYAYKNGINYFDTAWGYHDGNSELVAGNWRRLPGNCRRPCSPFARKKRFPVGRSVSFRVFPA